MLTETCENISRNSKTLFKLFYQAKVFRHQNSVMIWKSFVLSVNHINITRTNNTDVDRSFDKISEVWMNDPAAC